MPGHSCIIRKHLGMVLCLFIAVFWFVFFFSLFIYLFIYCGAIISSPGWKGMKRGKAVGLSLFSFPFPFAFSLFLFPLSFLLCWRASLLPTACLYQESRLAIRGGSERHWVKKKSHRFSSCIAWLFTLFSSGLSTIEYLTLRKCGVFPNVSC